LPGEKTPDNVTLEEAVALIDARIAAGGGKKRKAAPKKSAAGGAAQKPTKAKKTAKAGDVDAGAKPITHPKSQAKPRAKRSTSGAVKVKPAAAVVAAADKASAERKRKAG
jgi:DNA topoisomerase I